MGIRPKLLQGLMRLSSLVSLFIIFLLLVYENSNYSFLIEKYLMFLIYCNLVLHLLDTFIQKTKKLYQDTRTQRNISKLNDELYEVHQIMTRNVQEVLGVGEKLDRK